MEYFKSKEIAYRYDTYRPRLHHLVKDWIKSALGDIRFSSAIDVACGTGHSLIPLQDISDEVCGVDYSDSMLDLARKNGFTVYNKSYDDLSGIGQFDLITTGMAFHWFDQEIALKNYKQISTLSAVWIIYNFAFAGNKDNSDFNNWYKNIYLRKYPSPPRNSAKLDLIKSDSELSRIHSNEGIIPVELSAFELAGYFTTQTNIECVVQTSQDYSKIHVLLENEVKSLGGSNIYSFYFNYEIFRYNKEKSLTTNSS